MSHLGLPLITRARLEEIERRVRHRVERPQIARDARTYRRRWLP
jgi:hypothetical protein